MPLFPLFSLYFQKTDAAVTYEKLYSRGVNISGKLWGREQDNIGIGYGDLDGGNTGVEKSQIVEGYVRFGLNDYVALTLDAQYMDDKYVPDEGTNVDGWIVGARMAVEFTQGQVGVVSHKFFNKVHPAIPTPYRVRGRLCPPSVKGEDTLIASDASPPLAACAPQEERGKGRGDLKNR